MATTISIALPPPNSPPPYTSLLSSRRPRTLSLSTVRSNPAFMAWLSILLLRLHQNALVAKWLETWPWLSLPSTSMSSASCCSADGGALQTAWLRGWMAARQDYVINCWDAVWSHIFAPSTILSLPNQDKTTRKLALPPPPSSSSPAFPSTSSSSDPDPEVSEPEKLGPRSHETATTTTTTTTFSEKQQPQALDFEATAPESPESIVQVDVDSTTPESPTIIQVRLPPPRSSSSFEEVTLRSVEVEEQQQDAGFIGLAAEECSSTVCDSGYASSAEVEADEHEHEHDERDEEAGCPLTFIDSPVIRKHVSSFSYFEVTSPTTDPLQTVPISPPSFFEDPLDSELPTLYNGRPIPTLTLTPSPDDDPAPEYVPIQLSYHGTYLSVPAKPCYESLVHARRALRCTIVGWWGEVPDEEEETEGVLGGLDEEDESVEDIVYWLDDDEEELPDLPEDW